MDLCLGSLPISMATCRLIHKCSSKMVVWNQLCYDCRLAVDSLHDQMPQVIPLGGNCWSALWHWGCTCLSSNCRWLSVYSSAFCFHLWRLGYGVLIFQRKATAWRHKQIDSVQQFNKKYELIPSYRCQQWIEAKLNESNPSLYLVIFILIDSEVQSQLTAIGVGSIHICWSATLVLYNKCCWWQVLCTLFQHGKYISEHLTIGLISKRQ